MNKFCQSCGMPMTKDPEIETVEDGACRFRCSMMSARGLASAKRRCGLSPRADGLPCRRSNPRAGRVNVRPAAGEFPGLQRRQGDEPTC